MGEPEVNRFLTSLAVHEHVAASTQNQALAAVLFLYDKVLNRRLGEIGGVVRARRPRRLPVVLTRPEVRAVLGRLDGTPRLVCMLLSWISDLTSYWKPQECVERLYWCGFERDDDTVEVHTRWVRHKTSPFGSLSTPR